MKPWKGDSRQIVRKSPEQLALMRRGGMLLREVFHLLESRLRPGVRDTDLDRIARETMQKMGAKPAFLGYRGFPASVCISINEEVVHGVPRGRVLKEGDIVGIDIGLVYKEFITDASTTYAVGAVSPAAQRLMDVTREALFLGIDQMRPGHRVGDISAAIQQHAEENGYSVVRDYTGHGIGRTMHEAPECPNFVTRGGGRGKRLEPGVVIAIEPMVNAGGSETRLLKDNWTVVTADGSLSAHYEHTVAVTEDGPYILTL